MSELKSCPFCGGEAYLKQTNVYLDEAWRVACKSCRASSVYFLVDHPQMNVNANGLDESTRYTEDQAKEKAIEAWNGRTDSGEKDLVEFAEDVAYQFGYYAQHNGRLVLLHGGLSTLEWAFSILGWDNPHPVPECECEADGCHEHATCGCPTKDGYKRFCSKHYVEMRADNG